jgi:hypothetical protein
MIKKQVIGSVASDSNRTVHNYSVTREFLLIGNRVKCPNKDKCPGVILGRGKE